MINDHPVATPDYLVQLTHPGIPNHSIRLKVRSICSIMRNISINKGLVKNAHIIITNLGQRLIKVSTFKNNGLTNTTETHLIPRINFYFQPDYCLWTVHRKQFPLRLAYSTTFNSYQELTLDYKIAEEINTTNPSIQKKQNIINSDNINTYTILPTNEDNEAKSNKKKKRPQDQIDSELINIKNEYENTEEETENELIQTKNKEKKRKNYKNTDLDKPEQTANINNNLKEEITADEKETKTGKKKSRKRKS
ncbi:32780_t:CDS:2 [Gigaspora margarita]|uniref:32780_t:CDS:1 n=1 Tax=Gigaspora margarita TaxID=4874 RepID=A0ABN7U8B2_GIGMA|nr:32780_t:CDS:2 [Gigaspora margarita]